MQDPMPFFSKIYVQECRLNKPQLGPRAMVMVLGRSSGDDVMPIIVTGCGRDCRVVGVWSYQVFT